MIAFLKHHGFEQARQKGNHKFFRHPDGRTATVPDHAGEDLGRGLTNKIFGSGYPLNDTLKLYIMINHLVTRSCQRARLENDKVLRT